MVVLAFVLFIDLFAKLGVNFGIYATSCAMPQFNELARGDPYADLLFCWPGRGGKGRLGLAFEGREGLGRRRVRKGIIRASGNRGASCGPGQRGP